MTQQDKDILLQYLSTALFYGVKLFKVNEPESAFELYSINKESGEIKYYKYRGRSLEIGDMAHLFRTNGIPRFKPYLRTMSSMTEEEKKQYGELCDEDIRQLTFVPILHPGLKYKTSCHRSIIWLLKNHFDFIGLIPKRLAIAVTEENNPYRE